MPDTNYLLDAVDKLTKPHTTRVMQEKNGITCISPVDHEPLLLQLRNAVAGGIGAHEGSSSSARERIPFDAGAQALFDSIAKQINAWYITLPNAREERHIHDRLRDWYIDHANRLRAGKITDESDHATTKLVEGWAHAVEAMFDPPRTVEIPGACPECGGAFAIDVKTGDRITALVVEYRNQGQETMEKAEGHCRSCEASWRGSSGMRAMRWGIDNPPETPAVTSGGYTVGQLVTGCQKATEERNWKTARSLLGMLELVDLSQAITARLTIDYAEEQDRKARAKSAQQPELEGERLPLLHPQYVGCIIFETSTGRFLQQVDKTQAVVIEQTDTYVPARFIMAVAVQGEVMTA